MQECRKLFTAERKRPRYQAVLPPQVRFDERLSPSARLLYGEIAALIGGEGYCYASNAYFAWVYGLSERRITALIAQLMKTGYVTAELQRGSDGHVSSRRLRLCRLPEESFGAPGRKDVLPPEESFRDTVERDTGISEEKDRWSVWL